MGGTPPPFPGHHVFTPGRSSHSPSGQGSSRRNLVRSGGGTCPAPCGPHFGWEHSGFQAVARLQCESAQLEVGRPCLAVSFRATEACISKSLAVISHRAPNFRFTQGF